MRRLLFIAVLCVIGVISFGAPWALDGDVPSHKPSKSISKTVGKTLLPQLLTRREPLRYCVEGAPRSDKYSSYFEQGYNEWAASTARIIRKAKRADEFSDLLPFLDKPFLFKRQPCSYNPQIEDLYHPNMEETYWETNYSSSPEQIRLIVLPPYQVSRVCSKTDLNGVACAGVLESGGRVIVMPLSEETDAVEWWYSLLHEIGHTLGLGEGYVLGGSANNPLFGTKANRPSVMQGENMSPGFSCDDADAFIVFSDSLSIPGKPARTGKTARSFKSLCVDDPIWYVDGRQQNRPPRATGDAGGFSQTSYHSDGKVARFARFAPNPTGFSAAFKLSDSNLGGRPSSHADGVAYYIAQDGRTFAVEDLEDPAVKRIFTLKDNNLLGQTFLDFSKKDTVRAVTALNLQKNNMRLLRVESAHRVAESEDEIYFVYALFEGAVKDGTLYNMSARMAYVFKDWILVSLIEPGQAKTTTLLMEKDSRGQRMQVFQGNGGKDLAGGSFLLTLTDAKPAGALSDRDKKYLKTFASTAEESMFDELSGAAKTSITQLGKDSVGGISASNISSWAAQALDLHSKLGRALQYQFDGGLVPAGGSAKASAQLRQLFRPAPFVPSAKATQRR